MHPGLDKVRGIPQACHHDLRALIPDSSLEICRNPIECKLVRGCENSCKF